MARAIARKRRFRFGLPIVFAGRPSVRGVGLGCQPIRFAAEARFGTLGGLLPDNVLSDSKSPRRIFRRGLMSCDDENMQVICPTCQMVFAGSLERPDKFLCMGLFSIFSSHPWFSSWGAIAQRLALCGWRFADPAKLIATPPLSRLPLPPRIRYGCGAFPIPSFTRPSECFRGPNPCWFRTPMPTNPSRW